LIGNQNDWRDDELDKLDPVILENKKVRIFTDDLFEGVYLASPDQSEGLMQALEVTIGENEFGDRYIEFVMPSLEYWNMILMKR
jgi:dextranase